MTEETANNTDPVIELTAAVVSAYVSNNPVPVGELPALIAQVHAALKGTIGGLVAKPEALTPAVPIRKSVTPDYIISLEDGKKFKSLKRHLYPLRPYARRIPCQVGSAGRLSDGRAELCRGALSFGQDYRPGSKASPSRTGCPSKESPQ